MYNTSAKIDGHAEEISYFSIDWLSENDGPGQRVVLFVQGCHLDCAWCHSPHSQPPLSPLLYFGSLCIGCGACAEACPVGAHAFVDGGHILDRSVCVACGRCVEACPQSSFYKSSGALCLPTRKATARALYQEIVPQLNLLRNTGGITFSGGEPLLQAPALAALARLCKEAGHHTALETSGTLPVAQLEKIAPHIDTWLVGMRLLTGTARYDGWLLESRIRETLRYLTLERAAQVLVRIPVIPGYTDTPLYWENTLRILADFPVQQVDILRHNPESAHYYCALGKTPKVPYCPQKSADRYEAARDFFLRNNCMQPNQENNHGTKKQFAH